MKWGTYPWFVEHGIELIHPEDLDSFMKEANNCKVFECVGEGEYITLKYNDNCYKVRDKLFKPVPAPKYNFGNIVRIKNTDEEVTITDIMWHFGNREHYYLVCAGNKKKSKRYFESELI